MIKAISCDTPSDTEQIKGFRTSYRRIIEWITCRLIAESNVNYVLNIAEFYGRMRWTNFDGVYHDSKIEDIVEMRVLESERLDKPPLSNKRSGVVLIVSTLKSTGGHTRVVLNWMKSYKEEGTHRLLIVREMMDSCRESLDHQRIQYHSCANRGIGLINEVVAFCADAERIVLHIDPDDIVSAIAARILRRSGKQVLFYNHADHVFSFGISSATRVCEISKYGIELNRRTERVREYCYLGIPIEFLQHQANAASPVEAKQEKTILSGGDSYKYKPGASSFPEFMDKVLRQRNDVSFLLVGPTGHEPWWKEVKECWGERIRFLGGMIPHSDYIEMMHGADVYVDSFPITGGTAFPEALLNGKLVAGLNNPIQGYSPADELRVQDVQALTRTVIELLDRDPVCISRLETIREKTATSHSLAEFRRRVENAYAGVYCKSVDTNVTVDTYWFERAWERDRIVSLPGESIWFRLPLRFCVPFMLTYYRTSMRVGHKYKGYLMRRILFKHLPVSLRSWIRALYSRAKMSISRHI